MRIYKNNVLPILWIDEYMKKLSWFRSCWCCCCYFICISLDGMTRDAKNQWMKWRNYWKVTPKPIKTDPSDLHKIDSHLKSSVLLAYRSLVLSPLFFFSLFLLPHSLKVFCEFRNHFVFGGCCLLPVCVRSLPKQIQKFAATEFYIFRICTLCVSSSNLFQLSSFFHIRHVSISTRTTKHHIIFRMEYNSDRIK